MNYRWSDADVMCFSDPRLLVILLGNSPVVDVEHVFPAGLLSTKRYTLKYPRLSLPIPICAFVRVVLSLGSHIGFQSLTPACPSDMLALISSLLESPVTLYCLVFLLCKYVVVDAADSDGACMVPLVASVTGACLFALSWKFSKLFAPDIARVNADPKPLNQKLKESERSTAKSRLSQS